MDFTPTDEQTAMSELAARIVGDHCGPERLRDLDRNQAGHDPDLWDALVSAGLVGIAVPARAGGAGYGILEAALVAEAVGQGPGMVPVIEVVAAARALGHSAEDHCVRLAEAVATGQRMVLPALREGPTATEPLVADTAATRAGDGWTLTGTKRLVWDGAPVDDYLVSARTEDGPALFVVDAAAVQASERSTTTSGVPVVSCVLDQTPGVPVAVGDDGVGRLLGDLGLLRCAHYAGVARGALDLAADHCKQREQFGAPIGTFQAVAHRLADAWLDVNLMQSTYRQAAWRTDRGLPADQAAASAALWACEGGQRVVHAAQHVHGGVGMDLDYPVHRFFRCAKDIDLGLGGAAAANAALGHAIASEPLTIG